MGKRTLFLILMVLTLQMQALSDEQIRFARYPAISPDGKIIAFCYYGDIWTVPSTGGEAKRLTDHLADDIYPVWSPDGKHIAFSSDRNQNYDVFIIPKEGGIPKQITFHTTNDYATSCSPDGKKILFYSGRHGWSDLYQVDASGGTPIKLTSGWNEPKFYGAYSPDGKYIAYNDGEGYRNWVRKKILSPTCSDIHILDLSSESFISRKLTTFQGNDLWPMWSEDGKHVFYVSNQDGIPNIWKIPAGSGEPIQLTFHKEGGVSWPSISLDGKTITYEYDFGIWKIPTSGGEAQEVKIIVKSEPKINIKDKKTYSSDVSEYSLSPDGKKIALLIRGELFAVPAEDGGEARRLTRTPWRESQITWSPDSKKIVYVSDRSGNQDLFLVDIKTVQEERLTQTPENETKPRFSPDGQYIAYYKDTDKICFLPVGGGEEKIFTSGNFIDFPTESTWEFEWSPDSRWIVYTMLGPDYNTDIWVKSLNGEKPHNISQLAKYNFRPKWSEDGKMIYFSSTLNENTDIYKVKLSPEKIEFKEDVLDSLYEEKEKEDKEEEKKKEKIKEVKIDFENIEKRVERVTEIINDETFPVLTPDGKTFVFVSNILGKKDIWSLPFEEEKKELKQLTTTEKNKTHLMVTPDNKKVFYLSEGKVHSVDLENKKTSSLPFTAKLDIDYPKQREQMFSESWRILNSYYYDKDLHRTNWRGVKEKYYPILENLSTQRDFFELIKQMIGELNSSHLNIYSTDGGVSSENQTGYLGIELDYQVLKERELYKIRYVYPAGPADHKDSKLDKGEYILSLDGKSLEKGKNLYEFLNGKIGKRVKLLVNSKPETESAKEVFIKPISRSDYVDLVYEDWVEGNRRTVKEKSKDKLGYLHIRAMNKSSLDRFKKEVTSQVADKEGVIIDVRGNRGGWTGVYILEILIKKPYVMRNFRESKKISENKYRSNALEKPTVLLINQHSVSNAEIFAQGFRNLNLGKIIGQPTAGAVIGTSEWQLIDGSYLRKPSWGAYTVEGENLENNPRYPDITVEITLEDMIKGRDPQLERAIQELLLELE
ncbi:MAG: hypothetical protein AMJ90_06760 [candidate division Zixibacteria bacterium SM23_73_2]|nr:MAG: hypothetical protein AMJ90_06760 [candidate division Zixibacteria bacterium SM23_73_2]